MSWVWRQQCMAGLLIAATATGRTALVHQSMAGIYNLGHIQRWYVGPQRGSTRSCIHHTALSCVVTFDSWHVYG